MAPPKRVHNKYITAAPCTSALESLLECSVHSLVASPMCPIGNPEMLSTSNFYDGNVICVVWKDKLA